MVIDVVKKLGIPGLYRKLNSSSNNKVMFNDEVKEKIKSFYEEENSSLLKMIRSKYHSDIPVWLKNN